MKYIILNRQCILSMRWRSLLFLNPFFVIVVILLWPMVKLSAAEMLPAFPSAEGFGAVSIGGRGGRVIKVTNLNSDGPGSLQAAAISKGARIVVFDVAGVIRGDVEIKHSNITIAGQTAPSPGITIEGRLFSHPENNQRLHDIIVQFLRFRPPPTTGVNGDTIQLPNTERVMLDHLSLSWGNDEIIDIIHSSEVTIQWCTIEESDTNGHGKGVPHNFAILSAYSKSGNVSIHHNLFAHHARRQPSLSPYAENKPGDFRNNVVYNFYEGLGHDGHKPVSGINVISNYYKRGPDVMRILPFNFSREGEYHLSGNFIDGIGIIDNPHEISLWDSLSIKITYAGSLHNDAFTVAPVKTESAESAYASVLKYAGSFPRDRVTRRTINEVRRRNGSWGRHAPDRPSDAWFLKGLQNAPVHIDSDGDGIPDIWEDKFGLDKHNNSDNELLFDSGYTAIEEYLISRSIDLIHGKM